MSRPIISVENLGKRYRLRHAAQGGYVTFREAIAHKVRSLARRSPGPVDSQTQEDFWALRDVSFEIKQGDVVGIIGRNGAGKSTLLKVLSRITEPTTGRVRLGGRVASLLEVGTGFHPELTGRENIFLNGAILGMSKAEIRSKFDEIVVFAEVEKFLDTPVKHYSSGMYVRLAFAVAAHLEPEILVVDEVLAVGDSQFQQKCLGKMKDVAGHGRTVLFVSHNMGAVSSLCNRGLLLQQGTLLLTADIAAVIDKYRTLSTPPMDRRPRSSRGSKPLEIRELHVSVKESETSPILVVEIVLESNGNHKKAFAAFDLIASNGSCVMQALPTQDTFILPKRGQHRIEVVVLLPPLTPGVYRVTGWVGSHYTETLDTVEEAASFEICQSPTVGRTVPHTSDHGFIVPPSSVMNYDISEVSSVP